MTCTFRVLGCSGGISKDLRTTSFLLNDNILIDAGTGVGDLSLEELKKIDYLFLTHSHLDHICSLPFILDAVGVKRSKPLMVYGIDHTIEAIKTHILNDVIWPDFTKIPSPDKPCVAFEVINIGQAISIGNLNITALPVSHSIPANAYWIDSGDGALVFSGDTGASEEFWSAIDHKIKSSGIGKINNHDYLQHLIIETSFNNAEKDLANISGHYHPELLSRDLQKLNSDCNTWITHLKPDEVSKIMEEINSSLQNRPVKSLVSGQVLEF